MGNGEVKGRSEFRVLVVDDEKNVCTLLKESLKDKYLVDTCYNVNDALYNIESASYDVVITDLKLQDASGIDVLKYAKRKDKFIEVIIITGYGSVESASEAINLGVSSYLNKPLKIDDLHMQVERAIASRNFHLKSLRLLNEPDSKEILDARDHIQEITSLYYFTSKLMLLLNVSELMQIILEEVNDKLETACTVIGVNYLEFREMFAMPRMGKVNEADVISNILSEWDDSFSIFSKEDVEKGKIPLRMFENTQQAEGKETDIKKYGSVVSVPMNLLGERMGFIALFRREEEPVSEERNQFLYVFTSLISSAVQHCYMDLLAKEQAKTDSLTGVANHRMFHEIFERELSMLKRYKRKFSLIMIDIDDFKKINDTYGHLVGDDILVDLTKRIMKITRFGDVLARYGGEEFTIILPDTDVSGAEILANRICKGISDTPFIYSNAEIYYTVSIGLVACDNDSPIEKDAVIGLADEALYTAKKKGKNRVVVSRK